MLTILDKYIAKQFLNILVVILFIFLAIFILIDLIDHLDKFIESNITAIDLIKNYIYTIPWFISIALPMSMLLSTLFTMIKFTSSNEISAFKSSGISLFRISIPIILLGLFASLLSFYHDNVVVSKLSQKKTTLHNHYPSLKKKNKRNNKKHIIRQIDKNQFISIGYFDYKRMKAHDVSILDFNYNGQLGHRIDFKFLSWNENKKYWESKDFKSRVIDYHKINLAISKSDTIINIPINPIDLIQETVNPQDMNYWELKKFSEKIKSYAINDPRWKVNLHFKTALAFTNFILVLIGFPIGVSNKNKSVVFGVGIGIIIIFAYFLIIKFGQTLGYQGVINPFMSVWFPNILFLLIGLFMIKKIST